LLLLAYREYGIYVGQDERKAVGFVKIDRDLYQNVHARRYAYARHGAEIALYHVPLRAPRYGRGGGFRRAV